MESPPPLARAARWYRALAMLLLNTLVAFLLVNLVLYLPLRHATPQATPEPAAPPRPEMHEEALHKAIAARVFREKERFFPGLRAEQVAALMVETLETYARPFVYEPFTQFREHPYRGRFVNVDAHGFRRGKGQGPWPPDPAAVTVFVFGGSTTFGYGLPDDETVPSRLQDLLEPLAAGRLVHVYNFGRGYYFSTQERALFEQLVATGFAPDVAIFLDGLNDFYNLTGEPEFTARLSRLMAGEPSLPSSPYLAILSEWPIGRAAAWLRARATRPGPKADGTRPRTHPRRRRDARRAVRRVVVRFLQNRRIADAVGRAYGVQTVFVWQPVPTYKYDLAYHPFAAQGFGRHESSRSGYPLVARMARAGRLGPNFLWCADIQEGVREALYMDPVHYTPEMAKRVAGCIADGMARRGLAVGKRPAAAGAG